MYRFLHLILYIGIMVLPVSAKSITQKVTLDTYFNHEVDSKTGKVHHYTWDDTSKWGGYSQFGELFTKHGGTLDMLGKAPTLQLLKQSSVYIIVDPDHEKDNPSPNYMDENSAREIASWVRQGGRLLVLTNDRDNCDLTHINSLMDIFGLHFNDTTILNLEIPTKEHPDNVYPLQGIINGVDKMYMRGTCSIRCTNPAKPLVWTKDNDVVMAESYYGDGVVIAVADPWIYNEYIGHTLLPDNYDNATPAEQIVQRLLTTQRTVSPMRKYWTDLAYKMAQPVLEPMSKGELQATMQTEFSPSFDNRDRRVVYMECFGRLMAGIAPWLALPDDGTAEGKQRSQLRQWALASYRNSVDPNSKDYLCWGIAGQNLVDAAYIAESFLRAYDALWLPLDSLTKARYIHEFQRMRDIDPPYTNWFLFSSTIESFLAKAGAQYDQFRVNTACRKMEEWYVGDGWFSDGPDFAFNYYTSYVFHPMYLETLQAMIDARQNTRLDYQKFYDRELRRTQKYSIILERFISPEGTFPVFGRSIPYRMATMQPLALMAWYETLPTDLSPAQVRCALTKVMHRMFDQQENFNKGGYLTIGFCGSQPNIADWYTNNGSLYMTTLAFMPLGLPASSSFWTSPDEPWTQVKAWSGQPFPKDHDWKDNIITKDKW